MSSEARDEIAAGDRFAFGDNWRRFLETLDERKIDAATRALREFLGVNDLRGKTFIDVGSGSGLSSLAARRLGAQVTSFDYDPASVACTSELRRRYGGGASWRVAQGSVLDRDFITSLGTFDIVYSWGVLHHTGDLWVALDAVTNLVTPDGWLWIALYNDQGRASARWTAVKRRYTASGPFGRKVLLGTVGGYLYARSLAADAARRQVRRRGMDRRRDIVDWVGGWPFEVSSPAQVTAFYEGQNFTTVRVDAVGRKGGNNQFLFRRA